MSLIFFGRSVNLKGFIKMSVHIIGREGWIVFLRRAKARIMLEMINMQQKLIKTSREEGINISRLPSPRRYRVIYMIGAIELDSKRYRVFNLNEALKLKGIEGDYFTDIEIPEKFSYILSFDLIVLFRTPWTNNVETLVSKAKALNIPVIYDIDDYVFEPEIIPFVDGIRGWSLQAVQVYERGVHLYRQALLSSDFVTTSTSYLSDKTHDLGMESFVIQNTMNQKQIDISMNLGDTRDMSANAYIKIGYFSGTKTHQKDFSTASKALAKILKTHKEVVLVIGGYLDLTEFPELDDYKDRIDRLPFVPWEKLPHEIAKVDINIVPLEIGNPFCEGKSELKYFETGILKIPTVASATDTFQKVITHGVNGFLSSSEDSWMSSLTQLIGSELLRKEIGQRAYDHVLKTYTPESLAERAAVVYQEIIVSYRKKKNFHKDALSITFVVPPPIKGSGGHKDIFLIANCLAKFGHRVILNFILDRNFGSARRIRKFISDYFIEPEFSITLKNDIFSCDALIATHYTTADFVRKNLDKTVRPFYFVQDYEPYFNPMGEEYIKAEKTYRYGFQGIALGEWLKWILNEKWDCGAESIPFWIEWDIYYPKEVLMEKKIAFLSRPEMPRRCFNLCVAALEIYKKRNPDAEIIFFGSNMTKEHNIQFEHVDRGVISKKELSELYSEASIGISISTTNPSFVGYEMMACQCPVLDFKIDLHYDSLKYGSADNVFLVEPDPQEMAVALENIMGDEKLRSRIADRGYQYVKTFPDIEGAAKKFERILLDKIQQGGP